MSCDVWYRVYQATVRQVEFFRKRVRQGYLVDDALAFARYVQNSGICELLSENPPVGENPRHTDRLRELFPYDGGTLLRLANTLDAECCEYYRGQTAVSEGTAAGASKSDLEEINRKLDLMAGRLAALESVQRVRRRKPGLRVVPKVHAAS